jgi:hypothetical protein
MPDWDIVIAVVAIVISIGSLLWNWLHSESLFRRTQYPAVAWRRPEIAKEGHDTVIRTSIYNYGPKDITSIFLGAFLCRGFKSEAWCKSEQINKIPIDEELTFPITEELEKDINERFGELFYRDGWQFKGKAKRYKIIFRLEYQPLIADTPNLVRKAYYLIKPIVENGTIKSWEFKTIPPWQCWFPWF